MLILPGSWVNAAGSASTRSCLGAFIAHWSGLLDFEVQEIRNDYAHCEARDLAGQHGLIGAKIQRAARSRVDGRVQIQIVLDRGTLMRSELDPSDPHSDAELTFVSA